MRSAWAAGLAGSPGFDCRAWYCTLMHAAAGTMASISAVPIVDSDAIRRSFTAPLPSCRRRA